MLITEYLIPISGTGRSASRTYEYTMRHTYHCIAPVPWLSQRQSINCGLSIETIAATEEEEDIHFAVNLVYE